MHICIASWHPVDYVNWPCQQMFYYTQLMKHIYLMHPPCHTNIAILTHSYVPCVCVCVFVCVCLCVCVCV